MSMRWIAILCVALATTLPGPGQGKTVTYIHTDALGSPVMETNQAGQVVRQVDYRAYGEEVMNGPQEGAGYTGHYRDTGTGFVYMQQRYYDPIMGRFLSGDPVGVGQYKGANFNRFWYANNNPIGNIDSDGRVCVKNPWVGYTPMCERSLAYGTIDAESSINSKTRFFGAASVVTNAFGSAQFAQLPFNERLSVTLFNFNGSQIDQIRAGGHESGLTGRALDHHLVSLEQEIVQEELNQLQGSNPRIYETIVAANNQFLNHPMARSIQRSDPLFSRAVNKTRDELGGNIDFANQSHREALGKNLVDAVRAAPSLCTGTRLRSC